MKKHLVLSIILSVLVAAILLFGSYSGAESVVEGVAIIEAPEAVIWNHLNDFNAYNKWCNRIRITEIFVDSVKSAVEYTIHFSIQPGSMQWVEKTEMDPDLHKLFCLPQRESRNSFLENIYSQIGTAKLADGSVEVRWKMQYTVRPILARVLNNLVLKPRLHRILSSSLSNFKSYIEQ